MEKEKMENQKIEEKDLEKVAGGAQMLTDYFRYGDDGERRLLAVNLKEISALDKANLIPGDKKTNRYLVDITGEDYEKIKDTLKKSGFELTEVSEELLEEELSK